MRSEIEKKHFEKNMEKGKSSSRPFYELPAHVTPCSKIIHETRMQLKYSSKKLPSFSTRGAGDASVADKEDDGQSRPIQQRSAPQLGMRTVETQRPFTPRDSVSLWGVSQRKRPPSAITLSRLWIDEVDEGTDNEGDPKRMLSFGPGPRLKPLVAQGSMGILPSFPSVQEAEEEGHDSRKLGPKRGNSAPEQLEETRLHILNLRIKDKTSGALRSKMTTKADASPTNPDEGPSTTARHKLEGINVNSNVKHSDTTELQLAVNTLRSHANQYISEESDKTEVLSTLQKIRDIIRQAGSVASPRTLKQLLHVVFKLVEKNQSDDDILFWASFVLLHCQIVGRNLTTIFKMVFKASRAEDFQNRIQGNEYLDVLMRSFSEICPQSQTESMIYGYGILKCICGDSEVLDRVIDLDLVSIMALHLKILNCDVHEKGVVSGNVLNGAFQLTSILRCAAGEERAIGAVAQSGLLSELCDTLAWAMDDIDVLTNIVRILSVVSTSEVCCELLTTQPYFTSSVVSVLASWYPKEDVVLRLTYCLGNLLATSDQLRMQLFEEAGAFENIITVLEHYVDRWDASATSFDILVKTTRVLANWILNPYVGAEVVEAEGVSDLLYRMLSLKETTPELLLCVMCTLNNTSFYLNYSTLDPPTIKIVHYLYQNLDMRELDAKTEALKVLGNLTRSTEVRLLSSQYMANILTCLNGDTTELLCATCGVLINVIIEKPVQDEFLQHEGAEKVLALMDRGVDLVVSLMSCQVLWNLVISQENQGYDAIACFSPELRLQAGKIVGKILKDTISSSPNRSLNNNNDQQDKEDMNSNCPLISETVEQDFRTVATDLLSKLS